MSSNGEIINIALDVAITQKISEYKNRLLYDNVPDTWSAEEIADYLIGHTNEAEADKKDDEFKLDFIAFGREHVSKLKRDGRDKTAEGYNSALNNFCKFLKRDSIDINQINKAMLRYKDWPSSARVRNRESGGKAREQS